MYRLASLSSSSTFMQTIYTTSNANFFKYICRVSRLGQKIVLPIVLSTEFDAKLAFFGAIVPVSIALTLDQLILKPRRRKQIKE